MTDSCLRLASPDATMLTLFIIIGITIAVAITAVTIHALASAPEGYEDELGFHALSPAAISSARPVGNATGETAADDLPPFAAAR